MPQNNTHHNDTQHHVSAVMLSVIHAECHELALYGECHHAECRYSECRGTIWFCVNGGKVCANFLNGFDIEPEIFVFTAIFITLFL